MHPFTGKYDPWYRQSEDGFIKRAMDRAMTKVRSETDFYKFRTWNDCAISYDAEAEKRKVRKKVKKPNRLKPIDVLISEEMNLVKSNKFELFEVERNSADIVEAKWKDRHSLLAAPMGAEVFLSTERAGPDVMLGGAAYFGDEIFKSDDIPDARKRFPYSESANAAAKTMTFKLAAYINKKNFAASKIQQAYRVFKIRRAFKKTLRDYNVSACKVQYFFRLRRARVQFRLEKKIHRLKCVILIQRNWRMGLGIRRGHFLRRRRRNHLARIIVRWFRKQLKRFRKKRGTMRRLMIHATRLQAFFRAYKVRKFVWYWHRAQTAIAIRWRYYFKKKYLRFIIKLWRGVRNKALVMKVVRVQRFFRKWVRNKKLFQVRALYKAQQRIRGHKEQEFIAREVKKKVVDETKTWFALTRQCIDGDNAQIQGNPIMLFEAMSRFIIKAVKPIENLVTLKELQDMSIVQRISLAILAIFCNRPNLCIDYISWGVCKYYFMEESSDGNEFNGVSGMIDKLNSVEIKSLALILIPVPSLLMQATLLGRLTNAMLIQACLVRQFTVRLHIVCLNALNTFRSEKHDRLEPVSAHICPHCYEVFCFKGEYNKHSRLTYDKQGVLQGDVASMCFRNTALTWINKNLLQSAVDQLWKRCLSKGTIINHYFKELVKITIEMPEAGEDSPIIFVDSWGSGPQDSRKKGGNKNEDGDEEEEA